MKKKQQITFNKNIHASSLKGFVEFSDTNITQWLNIEEIIIQKRIAKIFFNL